MHDPGLIFFVFVLAVLLGVELINRVPSQLHTPLMSGANAISGITLVGAILALRNLPEDDPLLIGLGAAAMALATINVVGGYLVTDRMLSMFRKKGDPERRP
jgi:NAD(P) transhydrogenase subunit alpha